MSHETRPHTIRLHGPWRYELLACERGGDSVSAELPPRGVIKIPADFAQILPNFHGQVRFLRSFKRPTGLRQETVVMLVLQAVTPAGTVSINGHYLGEAALASAPFQTEITSHLLPRNELVIMIDFSNLPNSSSNCAGIVGEVRLEIWE